MILPKAKSGLAPADKISDFFQTRHAMKILDPNSKEKLEYDSNGTAAVLELLNDLTLNEKNHDLTDNKYETPDDDKISEEKKDDQDIDVRKLVRKGPIRCRTNPGRQDPYDFPQQPSLAQTTFINGRQMTGSQVSEAVWIESSDNEIPSSVLEISELRTLNNLSGSSNGCNQQWNDFGVDNVDCDEFNQFTEEEISRIVDISHDIGDNVVDEGFDQPDAINPRPCVPNNLAPFISPIQPNIADNISRTLPNSLESTSIECNYLERVCNDDPDSPDSAYAGSVGLVESPRNSPKSDFYMPQSVSPRYQDSAVSEFLQIRNIGQQFVPSDDKVTSWQWEQRPELHPSMNIPLRDVRPQYELLDISYLSSGESDICVLNVPQRLEGVSSPPKPSNALPLKNNTSGPRHEKKKINHRISQPKKNLPTIQSSGPPATSRKATDQSLQKRLESMMQKVRKEAVWLKTITETSEEFCKKNEQGQTALMELLLREPRLSNLVEAVFTRIGRIKTENRPDLLCHRDNFGHCALYQAATLHYDIPEIAAYIAETYASCGCDVNRPYENGNTILHYLAQLGDKYERVLDELLKLSVNGERIFRIDQRNDMGNTPLHVAAEYHMSDSGGSTFAIASTLIKHRGSVCSQNVAGQTPLHVAGKSKSCQPEYFRKLLEHRGAENLQDENGNTPLHLVALSVNVHNVEILKKVFDQLRTSNANPTIKNKAGQCPLDNVHPQCREVIRNVLQPKKW